MPTVKKVHKQKSSHRRRRSQKKKSMKGGQGQFNSDSLAAKYASCGSADRHNLLSGESNLNLIQGKNAMPPGYQDGGNGACPKSGETLTFKQYADNVAQLLYGTPTPSMTGGGYAIDPAAEQIGGQPARVGYSDCCPPVSVKGSLLMGANSGAVCGQQAGGKKLRKKSGKKHVKKGTQKRNVLKTQLGQNTNFIKQMGGDSVPALFPTESHNGADGDFNDKGDQLDYAAIQPFWGPTAR